jgi:hypothetical protein
MESEPRFVDSKSSLNKFLLLCFFVVRSFIIYVVAQTTAFLAMLHNICSAIYIDTANLIKAICKVQQVRRNHYKPLGCGHIQP